MRSLVQLSDMNPDVSDIIPTWLLNGSGDLHFTTWSQGGLYELDFGSTVGQLGYLRTAFIKVDGVVITLPRLGRQGGEEEIEVSVLLREEDMERLSANERWWRSWLVEDTGQLKALTALEERRD